MHFFGLSYSRHQHGSVMLKVLSLVLPILLAGAPAYAMSDTASGEKIFKKCAACHKVGEGAKNGIGPVLNDVFGRTAGSAANYKYGKDLKAAGQAGLVWTEEQLLEYLADPKKFIRAYLNDQTAKVKMRFRLKKEQERQDVVAYLKKFSKP